MIKRPLSTKSLHRHLLEYLSNEDIYQLCTELGLDYEDFVTIGGGRSYTLLRLLNYYRRRAVLMPRFFAELHTLRPDIDLSEFGGPAADLAAIAALEAQVDAEDASGHDADNLASNPLPHYENFDLLVSTAGERGRYFINARHSYAGGAGVYQVQSLDLEQETFQELSLYLEKLVARQEDIKALGQMLYEFLFPPRIEQLFINLYETLRREGRGVRIRLSIQPPELNAIAWEYCYEPLRDFFPAKNVDTPLVRLVQQPFTPDSLESNGRLRILLVLSSPNDLSPIDIDHEETLIRQALEPISEQISLHVLRNPTGPLLYQTVDLIDPHILHFVGHGRYKYGMGSLVIERDDGRARFLSADQLADVLHNRQTRIVVLNACETAMADEHAPAFNSVAQALVQRRIPAVIAMQYKVPDTLATRFAEGLYQQIAQGEPLDRAVTEMRIQASLGESVTDQVLWGIPVLFMRASDGRIWKRLPQGIKPPPSSSQPRPPISMPSGPSADAASKSEHERLADVLNDLLPRIEFVRLSQPEWGDVMDASKDIQQELQADEPSERRIGRKLTEIADIFEDAQVGLVEARRIRALLEQIER